MKSMEARRLIVEKTALDRILVWLSEDGDTRIRMAVAKNQNTSQETLEKLNKKN